MKLIQHLRLGLLLAAAVVGLGIITSNTRAQCGAVYPLTFPDTMLANVNTGDTLIGVLNGQGAHNFGWLSWTGSRSEQSLIESFSGGGNVETYINPEDPNDHSLFAGKWVAGYPKVSNNRRLRETLDALKGVEIQVPVWDASRGSGNKIQYHIVGFAIVKLTGHELEPHNRVSCVFLGYYSCGGGN